MQQTPDTTLLQQYRRVARLVAFFHRPVGGEGHATGGADLQPVYGPDGATGHRSRSEEILNGHRLAVGENQREGDVYDTLEVNVKTKTKKTGQSEACLFVAEQQ